MISEKLPVALQKLFGLALAGFQIFAICFWLRERSGRWVSVAMIAHQDVQEGQNLNPENLKLTAQVSKDLASNFVTEADLRLLKSVVAAKKLKIGSLLNLHDLKVPATDKSEATSDKPREAEFKIVGGPW
jgi:hypothetical protein